jgi:Fic family protein
MYKNVAYFAKQWNISERRVRTLCESGRISGAIKVGRNWSIPSDAIKPSDDRLKQDYFNGIDRAFIKEDKLKDKIDSNRPLSKNIVKKVQESLIVEWTYNSNAIEGNTLTIYETKVVLEGITVGGKSLKEHLEVINHREAILYLESLINNNAALNEFEIKTIHNLVLRNIDSDNAGKYRSENVLIAGAKHIPPNHILVREQMEKLMNSYHNHWINLHPIVKACLLHGEFVKVHPFIDGNGRTARLLLNFELMKFGYPPIVIKTSNRLEYYEVLDFAHTKLDYSKFISLISKLVIESEENLLKIII